MSANPASTGAGRKLPFTLQREESVLVFCRRHIVYLVTRMVGIGAAGLLPIAALLVLAAKTFGLDGTAGKIVLGLVALWAIYWAIRGYFAWFRYQNDIWVITNQRIVDSVRRHWFHHRMASADLVDVEDINVVKEGLFATAFNYGDVRCQTAGEVPNFILAGIPKPTDVLAVVDSARDAARRQLSNPTSFK
jgi:hypothetical protein